MGFTFLTDIGQVSGLPFKQRPRRTFYTGCFYAGAHTQSISEINRIASGSASKKHLVNLRILSLIFERIYFPRSHLLTFLTPSWAQLVRQIISDKSFARMVAESIIDISVTVAFDVKSDTERIRYRLEKLGIVDPLQQNTLENIVKKFAVSPAQNANSSVQSQVMYEEMSGIAQEFATTEPTLFKAISEAMKRSEGFGVPFLHEAFLKNAVSSSLLDHKRWHEVQLNINSLYIRNGTSSDKDMIAYYDPNLETQDFVMYRGIDRRLYSANTILTVLSSFCEFSNLQKVLQADEFEFMFRIRNDRDLRENWKYFKIAYFEMA